MYRKNATLRFRQSFHSFDKNIEISLRPIRYDGGVLWQALVIPVQIEGFLSFFAWFGFGKGEYHEYGDCSEGG